MKEKQLFDYLERLSNLLRNEMRTEGSEYGLQPIQMEALYYLSICNRYSDTPMGVTEYLGQTKGTVSQTIKVLEKKGLITKNADKNDKRLTHLKMTLEGKTLLAKTIPPPKFSDACDVLNQSESDAVTEALNNLLKTLQKKNNLKAFGTCKACRHNIRNTDGSCLCGLTKEPLSEKDIELICREYE